MAVSEHSKAGNGSGVARRVYVAAAAMVFAFLATIVFVVQQSSAQADKFALEAELRSIDLEFDRFTREAIREHSGLSYWDDSAEALGAKGHEDMDFVEEQIGDWLIADLGYGWVYTVAVNGEAGIAVVGDQTLRAPKDLPIVEANADLAAQALALYRDKRVRTGRGYLVAAGREDVVPGLQATAFRSWNGVPGLAIAQVIVPDTEDYAIGEGKEMVLVAFKELTDRTLADMGRRLGLLAPQIVSFAADVKLPVSHIALANGEAAPELAFEWRPRAPRPLIIRSVAPLAAGLCILICAVLAYIVTRHARTLHALAESEERNRLLATHDALTGLPNRSHFDDVFAGLIGRDESAPVAVLCIDLDRFKTVNDSHGHHAGDAVLRAVAKRFRDRIGGDGLVARIGGDEFIALVTSQVDYDFLTRLGEGLVHDASQPVSYHGYELLIGASVGIAVWPRDGRTAREVITAADHLLYRSKGEGRGRTSIAGGKLAAVAERRSA